MPASAAAGFRQRSAAPCTEGGPVRPGGALGARGVGGPPGLLMRGAPKGGAGGVGLSARPAAPAIRVGAAVLRSHAAGSVLGEHTPLSGLTDERVPTPTEMAARAAYDDAGIGPRDFDVVEVQDTDSGREILSVEELGLCPPGGGGRWVRDGGGALGSRQPVNA